MKGLTGFSRTLLGLLALVLAAVLCAAVLMMGVYALPTQAMDENMASSVRLLLEEGQYPELFAWCTSQLDNWTDTLMLQHAVYPGPGGVMEKAMLVSRQDIAGIESPYEVLAAHYGQGVPYDGEQTYYQYWHGYLLLLKPLLLLTDLHGVRLLNAVAYALLTVGTVLLLLRRGKGSYILPYLISMAMLCPWVCWQSMQFSVCYFLIHLGLMGMLTLRGEDFSRSVYLFAALGICTAFFDYLTYPLAVLGVPAVLYCCLRPTMTWGQTLQQGAGLCAGWALGYGGMWVGKWVMGSLITGQNFFTLALAKIAERSSMDGAQDHGLVYNVRVALTQNIKAFLRNPAALAAAVFLAAVLVLLLLRRRQSGLRPGRVLQSLFPFAVLACMPLVWYAVLSNHSMIHYWFANKALVVSAFAVLCAPVKLLESRKE